MSSQDWLTRISKLDARVVFTLIFILMIIPLVSPMGLPIPISKEVQSAFNFVESLPKGSIVYFGNEYNAPAWMELGPSYVAVLKHLKTRGLRFVFLTSFYGEALTATDGMIKVRAGVSTNPKLGVEELGLVYGKDFVDLGYLPGGESALAAFAANPKVVKTDRYGNAWDSIPLCQDIKTPKDFALCVQLDPGAHLPEYLRQFQETYGLPFITITYGVTKSAYIPYIISGQLKGMMAAIDSAAQYEQLIKKPAEASAGMDAVSTSHMLAAALMIIGNVAFFVEKQRGKGKH